MVTPSRRAFCVASLSFAASPAIPFAIERRTVPDPVIEIAARYLALTPVLAEIQARRDAAYERAVAVIGECPMQDHAANKAWWDRYRTMEVWDLDGEWQRAADEQCGYMDALAHIPAVSYAGVAAKLRAWLATHEDWADDNEYLIEAVIADLEALS